MSEAKPVPENLRGAELFAKMKLHYGLDDDLKTQLVAKTQLPHILASTPKDLWDPKRGYGRFANLETLEQWLVTHQDTFALTDADSLVGLVWFRPETDQDKLRRPAVGMGANVVFATRLYEHIGKGLASPMYDAAIKGYVDVLQQRGELDQMTGIVLETDEANLPARKSYERTGWQYSHSGYESRVDYLDGTYEMRPRVLMEMMPEAVYAAYDRAVARESS